MITEKIKLISPSMEMRNRIMDYRAAFIASGEKLNGCAGLIHYQDFNEWLNIVSGGTIKTPEGKLPASTYVAVRLSDNAVVGFANVRHYLTEATYHYGHIGYSVHPSERRKGYGTEILRLALIKAEQFGILEACVSCDKNNTASKRVMEKNKMKFKDRYVDGDGNPTLIYTKVL